jgi:hypothetical protein
MWLAATTSNSGLLAGESMGPPGSLLLGLPRGSGRPLRDGPRPPLLPLTHRSVDPSHAHRNLPSCLASHCLCRALCNGAWQTEALGMQPQPSQPSLTSASPSCWPWATCCNCPNGHFHGLSLRYRLVLGDFGRLRLHADRPPLLEQPHCHPPLHWVGRWQAPAQPPPWAPRPPR